MEKKLGKNVRDMQVCVCVRVCFGRYGNVSVCALYDLFVPAAAIFTPAGIFGMFNRHQLASRQRFTFFSYNSSPTLVVVVRMAPVRLVVERVTEIKCDFATVCVGVSVDGKMLLNNYSTGDWKST